MKLCAKIVASVNLLFFLGIGFPGLAFANTAPRLSMAEEKHVVSGDPVRIRAQASDSDNDSLAFYWEQTDGETMKLRGTSTDTLSFTAPEVSRRQAYDFNVTVSDGSQNTEQKVTVYVDELDESLPEADAGRHQTVKSGEMVYLSGSATDADSLALTFSWSQLAGPDVSFVKNTAKTSFIAPVVAIDTSLSFQLTVDDGDNTSSDTITVLVKAEVAVVETITPLAPSPLQQVPEPTPTAEPIPISEDLAFIEGPATAKAGEMVHLTASVDDANATYFWRVTNVPLEVTDLYTRETTLVIPLNYSIGQEISVELTVFTPANVIRKQHDIFIIAGQKTVPVERALEGSKPPSTPSPTFEKPASQNILNQFVPTAAPFSPPSPIVATSAVTPLIEATTYSASAIQSNNPINPKLLITAILVLAGLSCMGAGMIMGRKKVVVGNNQLPQSSSHIYIYEQRK